MIVVLENMRGYKNTLKHTMSTCLGTSHEKINL